MHGCRCSGRDICDFLVRGALVTDHGGEEQEALEGEERVLGSPRVGEGEIDEEAMDRAIAVDGVGFRA